MSWHKKILRWCMNSPGIAYSGLFASAFNGHMYWRRILGACGLVHPSGWKEWKHSTLLYSLLHSILFSFTCQLIDAWWRLYVFNKSTHATSSGITASVLQPVPSPESESCQTKICFSFPVSRFPSISTRTVYSVGLSCSADNSVKFCEFRSIG